MKHLTCLCFVAVATCALHAATPPNVVLILTDDQGWTGTSVPMDKRNPDSASDLYRTPNLERLAQKGMRFSNGYAPAPNCSPTRMSIQTGKTAARLGATDILDVVPRDGAPVGGFFGKYYINKPLNVPFPIADLPHEELTIAELVKQAHAGYKTAHFGKWHMAGGSPDRHGYDVHHGPTTNGPGRRGQPDPKRTGEVTEAAVGFLDRHGKDNPFFMQVSYYAVHNPVLFKRSTIESYSPTDGRKHINVRYASMTEELDVGLGRILDKLEELGLVENTYVIYTSDNGAEITEGTFTNNEPLAKGKTHVWEGGIRVPLVISGPGIEANSQCDAPAIGYDFLPTIADWVGASNKLPDNLDGGSLVPVLSNGGRGNIERGTEFLVWYYSAYRNHKHVAPQAAIRHGNHKLIWEFETDLTRLYDLSLDLSETTDLSRFQPDVSKRIHQQLKSYFKSVDAKLPTINVDYDPGKDPSLSADMARERSGDRRQPAARRSRE